MFNSEKALAGGRATSRRLRGLLGGSALAAVIMLWPSRELAAAWPGQEAAAVRAINSGSVQQKLEALAHLAALPSSLARAGVLTALSDDDVTVRSTAAQIALARGWHAPGERCDPYLSSQSPEDKIWAVQLIAPSASPQQVRLMAPLLADFDSKVRLAAAWALGRVPENSSRGAAEALLTALSDTETQVRDAAANSLGHLGVQEAAVSLSSHLRDPDASVRRSVAIALGALGDKTVVGALVGALTDAESEVVASAARSLGYLEDPAGQVGLLSVLERSPFGEAERAAAQALLRQKDKRALEVIVRLLARSDARQAVLDLLSDVAPSVLRRLPLVACLQRAAQAHLEACLGVYMAAHVDGAAVSFQPIFAAVADGRLLERDLFRFALGVADEELSVRALQTLAQSTPSEPANLAAMSYLLSLPELPDSLELSLRQVLERNARGVQGVSSVLRLLARLQHPNWQESDKKYLAATDARVQSAAASLLVRSGNAEQALEALLVHQDVTLAQAAVDALSEQMSPQQAEVVVRVLAAGTAGRRLGLLSTLYGLRERPSPELLQKLTELFLDERSSAHAMPHAGVLDQNAAAQDALLVSLGRWATEPSLLQLFPRLNWGERVRLLYGIEQRGQAQPKLEQLMGRLLQDSEGRVAAVALEVAARTDHALPDRIATTLPDFVTATWVHSQRLVWDKKGSGALPQGAFSEELCSTEHVGSQAALLGWAAEAGQSCASVDPLTTLLESNDATLRWAIAEGLLSKRSYTERETATLIRCAVYESDAPTNEACVGALFGDTTSQARASQQGPQSGRSAQQRGRAGPVRTRLHVTWASHAPALVPHAVLADGQLRVLVSDRGGVTMIPSEQWSLADPVLAY